MLDRCLANQTFTADEAGAELAMEPCHIQAIVLGTSKLSSSAWRKLDGLFQRKLNDDRERREGEP